LPADMVRRPRGPLGVFAGAPDGQGVFFALLGATRGGSLGCFG
jgi:hypothetical protein